MLDKAIKHNKEKRKPYYRNGKYCLSCRPHGGCPYCLSNRTHSDSIRKQSAEDKYKDELS